MQHVPALAIVGVAIELLVTGHAPDVGGDAVLLLENLLRLENFEHDGSAAQQLSVQFSVGLA